jgi:hypothetical protein
MTNQHRATPEQWEYQERWASDDDDASCILELRCRVEALEATQHAHADVSRLSDAEREQVTQELAKPATWRPLDIETTCGTEAAADGAQIMSAFMVVDGTFEHGGETYRFKAKPERVDAMNELRAASAEVRPGGLAEQLAALITSATTSRGAAEDVLRQVAAATDQMAPDKNLTWERVALWLEREANHG